MQPICASPAPPTAPSTAQGMRIEVRQGKEIEPFVKELSLFFDITYREYPYFYDTSRTSWDWYIQSYVNTPNSVVCMAFEGDILAGAAIGTALNEVIDYSSFTLFFEKQGFRKRDDIHFDEYWKDVFGTEKVPHRMVCWTKNLSSRLCTNT